MKITEHLIKEIAFRTFVSFLFCTLFGYLFWAGSVFNHLHTSFRFIAIGIIGSLFFHSLRFGLRNAIATLFIVSLIFLSLIMKSWGPYLVRDLLIILFSALTIYFYHKVYYGKDKMHKLLEPFILGLILGVANLVVFVLLVVFRGMGNHITFLWAFEIVEEFYLIGFGIGIGIIIPEKSYSTIIIERLHRVFE